MALALLEMIEEAFERCQLDPRAGYDARTAKRSLNLLLSEWTNRGLNLWVIEEITIPLTTGTSSVAIPAGYFDVMDAALRDESQTPPFDITLDRISPTDYLAIPFKAMTGMPTQFSVVRTYNAMTVKVWQVPSRDYVLVLNMLKTITELTGYTSTVEIPDKFQEALISGLAWKLSIKRAPQRSAELKAYYEDAFALASDEERDRSSFYLAPEMP